MDWCIADDRAKANHNPKVVLNGEESKRVLALSAKGGSEVSLTSQGTTDPDGNSIATRWWIYQEAGTLEGATLSSASDTSTAIRLPEVEEPRTLHVILEAEDDGTPSLFAFRRAVIEVTP